MRGSSKLCLALPDSPLSVITIDSALDLQSPSALATDTGTMSSVTPCMEQASESCPLMKGGVSVLHESATCIPSSLVEDSSLRDDPKSGMKSSFQ